jgi:hypothetical protein
VAQVQLCMRDKYVLVVFLGLVLSSAAAQPRVSLLNPRDGDIGAFVYATAASNGVTCQPFSTLELFTYQSAAVLAFQRFDQDKKELAARGAKFGRFGNPELSYVYTIRKANIVTNLGVVSVINGYPDRNSALYVQAICSVQHTPAQELALLRANPSQQRVREFIDRTPVNSKAAEEARALLASQEKTSFQQAQKAGTLEAHLKHLDRWPSGQTKAAAQAWLMRTAEKALAQGNLEPMRRVATSPSAGLVGQVAQKLRVWAMQSPSPNRAKAVFQVTQDRELAAEVYLEWARSQDTAEAYAAVHREFGGTIAAKKAADLELSRGLETSWATAQAEGTVESYERFYYQFQNTAPSQAKKALEAAVGLYGSIRVKATNYGDDSTFVQLRDAKTKSLIKEGRGEVFVEGLRPGEYTVTINRNNWTLGYIQGFHNITLENKEALELEIEAPQF